MPQEEKLEIGSRKKKLIIGLPKEVKFQERRIALIPDAVKMLVENGHEVIVEKDAGAATSFSDHAYAEAGAEIVGTAAEVFQSEVILKVAPICQDDIDFLKERTTLLSALHLTSHSKSYFQQLIRKKTTAIAFEYIKDKTNSSPVTRSISEIVGATSIHIASKYLAHHKYGMGRMLGGFTGIAPAEIVILGAGTVSEYATKAALGFGALVKVFDNSIYKLKQLQERLHQNIFTSIIQPAELLKALLTADAVICAIHARQFRCPIIITEDMVSKMKAGSIIVDVSIDQGGCVETSHITTHNDPVFQVHGVTHYCVPNIASMAPQTASVALSNFFAPLLIKAGEMGGIEKLLGQDYYFRHGVYLLNGIVTSNLVGEYYDLPFQDIDLLMAAFR
ncbi:MAG: alanine dehydrogenase [Desulfobacterales bacterium]|nr:alanine dehydrogenase [Desulfobacterales bacterium]